MPTYFNSTSSTPWKTAKRIYKADGGRVEAKDGKWIQKAKIKKGALRSQMGIKKGKKIPLSKLKAAAKKGGKLGKRANLALTFRKMRKG
tara:strand:- start:53 stop:319 length:267 start_codon:yes stop_codon:yes gene_type:complete